MYQIGTMDSMSNTNNHFDRLISEKSIKIINAAHMGLKPKNDLAIEHFKLANLGSFSFIKPNIDETRIRIEPSERLDEDSGLVCKFNEFQIELYKVLRTYKDLLFTSQNNETLDNIQQVYTTHVIRHILDAQSRIMQTDKKFSKKKIGDDILRDDPALRDQGYTRAKVLFLLPFRSSALRLGKYIHKVLSETHVIHNMDRFIQEFCDEDGTDTALQSIANDGRKPNDYYETFRGNTDDSFRVGVKVTKKSVKLFSEFYDSDIIIASPLGLKTILTPDDSHCESIGEDKDFLSSIEIVILDQAEVFLMQNWEHIMDIMQFVNLMPAKPRKMDISRVRLWHLENWSKYYRQLIMFSSLSVPLVHSFFQSSSLNYEGYLVSKHKVDTPQVKQVTTKCNQHFLYYDSTSAKEASNARFSFFIKKVLPRFCANQNEDKFGHTLIVVSSYFDYVRLRNHFRRERMSFTQICEYSEQDKISKARQLFFFGARKVLLYTERCHYYNRYTIKGVRNIIFYEPPMFPRFYSEILNMLSPGLQGKKFDAISTQFMATTLFTRHDTLQLGAIIGCKHAVELIQNKKSIA